MSKKTQRKPDPSKREDMKRRREFVASFCAAVEKAILTERRPFNCNIQPQVIEVGGARWMEYEHTGEITYTLEIGRKP